MWKNDYRKLTVVITGLASSASLISLLQRWFDVGLIGVLAAFLSYYRKIAHLLLTPLLALIPIRVPVWYQDAYILSFIFFVFFVRTLSRENLFEEKKEEPEVFLRWGLNPLERLMRLPFVTYLGVVIANLSLFGFVAAFLEMRILVRGVLNFENLYADPYQKIGPTPFAYAVYFHLSLAIMVICSIVFFALNSLL